ncbi:MAG TPA: hypothetical protein VNE82_02945 [Candidatus Binataceae bacterium]|nr:hypothetical protein [Candidatus Binataceae bacterium]
MYSAGSPELARDRAGRGFLGEFGLIAAKGIRRIEELRERASSLEPTVLPASARDAINILFDRLDGLQARIGMIAKQILA